MTKTYGRELQELNVLQVRAPSPLRTDRAWGLRSRPRRGNDGDRSCSPDAAQVSPHTNGPGISAGLPGWRWPRAVAPAPPMLGIKLAGTRPWVSPFPFNCTRYNQKSLSCFILFYFFFFFPQLLFTSEVHKVSSDLPWVPYGSFGGS